jgi:uncharacterized membrane protein
MIPIPNPLHPAVVHFPIVLILLGCALAVVAVLVRKWHLPVITAVLLSLGALGAIVATTTGEADEELLGELAPAAEHILDEHEDWGEFTRNIAIVAAILAVASAVLTRFVIPARILAALAALVAIGAAYGVVQTGHYGGQLVYKHGAGVNTAAGNAAQAQPAEQGAGKKHNKDDDDD